MVKEWPCEHINMKVGWTYYEIDGKSSTEYYRRDEHGWNFCPACGAARPKEPDAREILMGILYFHNLPVLAYGPEKSVLDSILEKFELKSK